MSHSPTYEEMQKRLLQLEKQVAEQQESRKSLEESNIQMLDMLESISDGFFSLDQKLLVTYFNGAAERLLGRKSWEILGHPLFEAFPEIKGSVFEEKFTEAMNTKSPLAFETYFAVAPYENWYDVRVHPRQDGILVFFQVTTENHRVEEAKAELEMRLRNAEKVRAVAKLASGVANDFNNLLSVIQSNVSLALFDLDVTHPHYETFQRIESQVRSGAKLSSRLLGYARKGRYATDPVDLNEIVEAAVRPVRKGKKDITVDCAFGRDLPMIEADVYQIKDVVDSIVANSVEAMSHSGKLTVRTERVTHERMKGMPWRATSGTYALLSVGDTGIGMDETTLRQVYTPFFTTKAYRQEGAGLSMAAVYGVVKGHGGYIDISSEQGHGTIVSIFFPGQRKGPSKKKGHAIGSVRGTEAILLVDDDAMILEVGSAMLGKLGYTVIRADGGKEAIDVLEKEGRRIALVILDMIMADMGGGEVFKRIKEMGLEAKIVLATGCSLDGRVRDLLERGCDGILQKPFGMRELSEKVRESLDQG